MCARGVDIRHGSFDFQLRGKTLLYKGSVEPTTPRHDPSVVPQINHPRVVFFRPFHPPRAGFSISGDPSMSKQLREFQSRKSTLVKEARALTDRLAADNRDMSDEEVTAFDALRTRIDAASASIDREAALISDEARIDITSAIGPIVTDNRKGDAKRGFYSIGEFVQAVYQADKPRQLIDSRLPPGGISAATPAPSATRRPARTVVFSSPRSSRRRSSSCPWARTRCCRSLTTSRSAATAWPSPRMRPRPGAPTAFGPTGKSRRPRQ